MLSLAAIALAVVVGGCTTDATSATAPPNRTRPDSTALRDVPSATVVPLPVGGRAGPVLSVTGVVSWAVLGRPGCAFLRTDHRQLLSLVGPVADELRHDVAAGKTVTSQPVRVAGYVPAAVATACGGDALTFRALQVSPMPG